MGQCIRAERQLHGLARHEQCQAGKPRVHLCARRGSTKHSFHWTSTNVVFESQETPAEDRVRPLASWVFQPTNPAACIAQKAMPVHINLWCFRGKPPNDGKEVELIVRAVKFPPP